MFHEMKIFGFAIDSIANRPVVILKDAQDSNTVPLWINPTEAVAIAAELMIMDEALSGGHVDLLSALMGRLRMTVEQVSIEGVNDGVFSATVRFLSDGEEVKVAVRPCEALIAALKYKLPVMVAEEVLQRASVLAMNDEEIARENNARRFVDFLENLDPAVLGKYPM